jgi:von Willebrand factor type A domain
MAGYSTSSAQPSKPLVPAWLLSVVIHAAMIIALCVAIKPFPHGAADGQYGSMGLVLHRTGTGDTLGADGRPIIQQTVAMMDEPAPPLLLASAEIETKEPATAKEETPTQPPKSASGTSTSQAKAKPKQTNSSGRASGRATGIHGSSGTSGYGQTSVFGVQGKGNKFIYVFDRSGSMEGRPLAAAKKQLLESLQSLESVNQFHIIFFNTKTQSIDITGGGHRIAFASDRNKKLAGNFVGGITADGGTDRMYALREALNFAPDVIFFLTDAEDAMSASEMAELARANRRVQASICVIEFGKNPAPTPNNFLARLAHDNGGQYGYVDTTKLK